MATLTSYLSKTRFFLRDALSTAFSDADLTDLINQARADVIMDTFCCRSLVQIPTVANQEAYTFATVLTAVQATGATAVAVLQINSMGIFWSSNLVPVMDNMPWDEFSAIYRSFRSYTFIPFVWAMYDLQTFYVAPLPNSIYTLEIDCTYLPNLLSVGSPNETVIPPGLADFTLVPWLAASHAKYNQNAYKESEAFFQKYALELNKRMGCFPAYRIPSLYGADPRRP